MYNSKWNEIATTVPEYWESYLEEKIGEIHSRHIEAGPYGASFGLITDLTLEFSDSINVIEGQNESGKSTIAAFIKYMLYGFDGSDSE